MSDHPLSAEKRPFPPSMGLLRMAARLALRRVGSWWTPEQYEDFGFMGRDQAAHASWAVASREYYAILDRIARGEKP